ncbi:MAG TPA: alpha/beta fold hydrolase [Anaerolineae bacterium]|nr:alpha/beta fold hydrolase [Anaerolineae bacterium]HOR01398.1 alpha/beta fold hydrolase [Anaerolineae bacterium]
MATKGLTSKSRPAASYAEAVARIGALQAEDTAAVSPVSRLIFLTHGQQAERAIVFFHGYTSSPAQFRRLGEMFYELGYNVLIPRLPHHGLSDRLAPDHALLTAEELARLADEASDIALGLGEQVTVAGLSMGGVMAGWAAQERAEVSLAAPIAPGFGLYPLPARLARPFTHVTLRMPNVFRWWDPVLKDKAPDPGYGYPRYSTHALAQMLRLSAAVQAKAKHKAPATRNVLLVTNANDLSVDNRTAQRLVAAWQRAGAEHIRCYEFPAGLGLPHDLIDPAEPLQQTDVVYPVLVELLQGH